MTTNFYENLCLYNISLYVLVDFTPTQLYELVIENILFLFFKISKKTFSSDIYNADSRLFAKSTDVLFPLGKFSTSISLYAQCFDFASIHF
jgi:hypothetical protein